MKTLQESLFDNDLATKDLRVGDIYKVIAFDQLGNSSYIMSKLNKESDKLNKLSWDVDLSDTKVWDKVMFRKNCHLIKFIYEMPAEYVEEENEQKIKQWFNKWFPDGKKISFMLKKHIHNKVFKAAGASLEFDFAYQSLNPANVGWMAIYLDKR